MVHGYLDWSTTSAIATSVTLAHSNSTKRRRVLISEAYPAGQMCHPTSCYHPSLMVWSTLVFAFHDDDEGKKPMMSSTTSECSCKFWRTCPHPTKQLSWQMDLIFVGRKKCGPGMWQTYTMHQCIMRHCCYHQLFLCHCLKILARWTLLCIILCRSIFHCCKMLHL
jgi:hypothetical protein